MKKAIVLVFLLTVFWATATRAQETSLFFSEIMYDWPGADTGQEWVEVFNSGGPLGVIFGSSKQAWRFFDGANHTLSLAQGTTTIAAGEYFVLTGDGQQFLQDHPDYRGTVFDTVMSLPNSTGNLGLSLDGGSTLSAAVSYDSVWGAGGNGFSLEKIALNQGDTASNWQESALAGGTPGALNSIRPAPPASFPQAVALCPTRLIVNETGQFDASGSTDPHNLSLSYLWDFSDGITATSSIVQHSFTSAGNYPVNLAVNNGQSEASTNCAVEVASEPVAEEGSASVPGGGGASQQPSNYFWTQIQISEFMPNPPGRDDGEWIELFNNSFAEADLSGFALQDNSTKIFKIENIILAAQGHGLFYKNETGISLNNSGGDAVKLYDPVGSLIEAVSYKDTAPENKSWARQNNNFSWNNQPTPGQANVFSANQAPLAKIKVKSKKLLAGEKIILSAEESHDPEEGQLSYLWDFGDDSSGDERIENHVYNAAGTFPIRLQVSDDQGLSAETSLPITITDNAASILLSDIAPIDFTLPDLLISEFIPDPVGSDDGEWMELYNHSDKIINLTGWQLDDGEGGSRPYIFPAATSILPGEFLLVSRAQSKLTLNNQNDSVRILTPLGDLWQEVIYQKIASGQSQAWDLLNQEWFVSSEPSPGKANVLPTANFGLSAVEDLHNIKNATEIWLELIALQDSNLQSRSLYTARNIGKSIDYEQVVEVYFSQKQWPDIKTGDALTVSGQLNNTAKGARLKISSLEQIALAGFNQPLEKTEPTDLNSLDDELANSYLSTSGVVVKKSGKNIYLASSAEEDSALRVYLDFDYKDLDIKKGAAVLVSGILQNTSAGWKLLVKNKKDFLLAQQVLGAKESGFSQTDHSTTAVAKNNRRQEIKIFLYLLLGLVLFFLILKLIKKYRRKKTY